jgi:hypothetical protein
VLSRPQRITAGIYTELPYLTEFSARLVSLAETPALADVLSAGPFPRVLLAVIAIYLVSRVIPPRGKKAGDA